MDECVQSTIFTQNFNLEAYIKVNNFCDWYFQRLGKLTSHRYLLKKITKGYISKTRKLNLEGKSRMQASRIYSLRNVVETGGCHLWEASPYRKNVVMLSAYYENLREMR